MTEVCKPSSHGKVASLPFVFQLELERLIIDASFIFYAYVCYSQKLENWSGHAQSI